MTAIVLIPFTSDEPWRVRARHHVAGQYRTAGFDVVEGTCPGPWRKAVAVADAASRAAGDIFVVADADCLCDGVAQAVAAVEAGAPWVIPHTLVHRLDEPATEAVYAGVSPAATTGRAQRPYRGFAGGGIVVLPRDTWDRIPIDPRFEGWGQEDEAWAMALTCLAGRPTRLANDLHHLWHPPPERLSRHLGSTTSRELLGRYSHAGRHPAAMRSLLDETRPAVMVR